MTENREQGARRETRDFALAIRAIGEEGVIEGYAAIFGEKNGHNEIVQPGAFAETLSQHRAAGTMPFMFRNHSSNDVIGFWEEMEEDQRGLRVKGQLLLEKQIGRDAYIDVKKAQVRGLSVGFIAKEDEYDYKTNTRIIRAMDLFEVSLVAFPSAKSANLYMIRSENVDQIFKPSDAERLLRDAAPDVFSKATATAFVSRLMRMGAERREAEIATERANMAAERLLRSLQS
jgi:HK97 family phage prohead protease